MNYLTNTTDKTTTLPVSLQQAKEHLSVVNDELDSKIELQLKAAVDYCEAILGRVLRVSHTVVQSYDAWPSNPVRFDKQPVYSISHIKYYDTDNTLQTVTSSDYRLLQGDVASKLEFDYDYTYPSLYDRSDAVQITYLAGHSSLADVPPAAQQVVLLVLERDWGDRTPAECDRIQRSVRSLLASLEPGMYR